MRKTRTADEPGPHAVPDAEPITEPIAEPPTLDPDAQLRILSACYDDVAEAQDAYELKAEAAKTAKKSLDAAVSALLEKVREYTHPTPAPLPLFDAIERENDLLAMHAANDAADRDFEANRREGDL